MKTLIALLIATNILTLIIGYRVVENAKADNEQKFQTRLNYLDLQYAGFCSDADSFGITNGEHYQILCGDK